MVMPMDKPFEEAVLEGLLMINQRLVLLSMAVAKLSRQEHQDMAVTQADVDALRQRVQADNATESAALDQIKADFAALQASAPADLDLTGLSADIDALDQGAQSEQQVGTDNAPPQPAPSGDAGAGTPPEQGGPTGA
jgi:hypothetical protein